MAVQSLDVMLFFAFVFLSALFAAMEVAFVSTSRLRSRSLFKQGKAGSEALVRLKENPRRLLITILLWSNAASVAASALATLVAGAAFGSVVLGIVIGVVTLLLLVFGDMVPKTLASAHHERLALLLAPPTELLVALSTPFVMPLDFVARLFTRAFASGAKKPLLTEEDLDSLVAIGVEEGTVGANEARVVRRALDFNDHFVEKVMTPASEVEFLPAELSVSDALAKSVVSRHHRFPVRDSRGRVVGVVHEKLLLAASSKGRGSDALSKLMHAPVFVKAKTPLSQVFEALVKSKRKLAVVGDEAGEPQGILTIDDIVQEIIEDLQGFGSEPLAKMPS